MERLVRSRLGLSAKWLLRRYRIEETHACIFRGLPIDLEALGSLLGYARREDLASDFRTLRPELDRVPPLGVTAWTDVGPKTRV